MQDYPSIEHLVFDGASTDGSVDMIRAWARDHPIVWRSEPDGGQAEAIQTAARLASGEIIAWLNSDDVYLDSGVVSDVVRLMNDGAEVVTGAGWYLTQDGRRERPIPVFPKRLGFDTLRYVDWVLQPATFVRRDVFNACSIDTSLHFAFDWDLFIQISKKTKFTPTTREIAGYRRHESGKTVSGASRRQRELLQVIRRYNGRLSIHYFVLLLVVTGHRIAERLPRRASLLATLILHRFALLTQWLTRGKGIPY